MVWHYLRDSTFSHFDTIPECDRHTQTDGQTHDHIAQPTNYNYYCRQRATVDSKMYGYYHIFER